MRRAVSLNKRGLTDRAVFDLVIHHINEVTVMRYELQLPYYPLIDELQHAQFPLSGARANFVYGIYSYISNKRIYSCIY